MDRIFLRHLLIFFLPAVLVICGAAVIYHDLETDRLRTGKALVERERVNAGVESIRNIFRELVRDIRFLTLSNLDDYVASDEMTLYPHLAADWLAFSQAKQVYDQVRWLDVAGRERLRVNLTPQGSIVVPRTELQDKSLRYYFRETIQLPFGGIFISPLDLNIENGQIELPFKPMIRLCAPTFDMQRERRGVIVLNYLASNLLKSFRAASTGTGRPVWLVNGDGYWLLGATASDEWGFMFGRADLTLAHRHPEAWSQIQKMEKGQFEDKDGLWTFATIRFENDEPLHGGGDGTTSTHRMSLEAGGLAWKAVALLPASDYATGERRVTTQVVVMTLLLLSLFLAISWLLARARSREIQYSRDLQRLVETRTLELNQRNAELERFIYTVSHDLKTPLVTLGIFLDLFELHLDKNEIDQIREDLHFMQNAAGKMKIMLDNLLEMSRVGRVSTPAVLVDFREIVDEVLSLVAGAIVEQGVTIKVSDTPQRLFGDRVRLVEIWQNLVENAVKYMGAQEHPVIDIGVEQTADGPVFYVRDNGMGIEPRHQEKIFGLFDKLDPQSEGAGIGLAIVKRIVELYQGRLWVESEGAGRGCCFRFTLPGALKDC